MKVRVLVHLPKEQSEMTIDVPKDKTPMEQEDVIANAIQQQYPNFYKWGVVQWVIDWPKEISV